MAKKRNKPGEVQENGERRRQSMRKRTNDVAVNQSVKEKDSEQNVRQKSTKFRNGTDEVGRGGKKRKNEEKIRERRNEKVKKQDTEEDIDNDERSSKVEKGRKRGDSRRQQKGNQNEPYNKLNDIIPGECEPKVYDGGENKDRQRLKRKFNGKKKASDYTQVSDHEEGKEEMESPEECTHTVKNDLGKKRDEEVSEVKDDAVKVEIPSYYTEKCDLSEESSDDEDFVEVGVNVELQKTTKMEKYESKVTQSVVKNKNDVSNETSNKDSKVIGTNDADVEIMSDSDSGDSDFEPNIKKPRCTLKVTAKGRVGSKKKEVAKTKKQTAVKEENKIEDGSGQDGEGDEDVSKSRKDEGTATRAKRSISKQRSRSKKEVKKEDKSKKAVSSSKKNSAKSVKTEICQPKEEVKPMLPSSVDHTDVMSVLLHMEGVGSSLSQQEDDVQPGSSGVKMEDGSDSETDRDSDEEDWEDVEEHPNQRSPKKSQIPKEPIEVTIDAPDFIKKRKKKEFDWKAYLKRQMNRFQKGLREDIHKVHLMLLLARGMYLNRVCSDTTLQAVTMSLTPPEFLHTRISGYTTGMLERLVNWYADTIRMDGDLEPVQSDMKNTLIKRMEEKKMSSSLEYVMIFVALLRCIGLKARLVLSLQPLPLKSSEKATTDASKKKRPVKGNPAAIKKVVNKDEKSAKSQKTVSKSTASKGSLKGKKAETSEKSTVNTTKGGKVKINDKSKSKDKNNSKGKALRQRGNKVEPNTYKVDSGSDIEDSADEFAPDDDDDDSDEDESDNDCEVDQMMVKERSKKKGSGGKKSKPRKERLNDSEDEFEEDLKEYRTPVNKSASKSAKTKANRKILSSDSEESSRNQGVDQWAEVYLKTENKWICIDCLHKHLNRPYRVESSASQPVHYVIAYFQDGACKDVTARYASSWMTDTRKVRVDPGWWEETLDPYKPLDVKADEREDQEIKAALIKRPMPTSFGAFKSHPLYALRRHLLKYEAIYPDTAAPLGYIRGEPVYARECVHELHSRDNWLKEARVVRIGEKPYKMVKSRAKWNKPKENPDALDLELFGLWQTEDYIPPPAVNGRVPRNEYGNVELFKPCMLPAGTVHIQIEGLKRVAKKLDIDCVPAMVGWDSHCGWSHPVLDGFIVCEEHKDTLLAAWEEDQELQQQREAEKREKRALNNWKVLIKGLLIKERLKKRFDLQEEDEGSTCEKVTKKFAKGEKATDAEMSWPRKQQEQKMKKNKGKNSQCKNPETDSHFKVETL